MLQQSRDILKKVLEIMSKIDSLAKKNEEFTSHVSVAQNTSTILQEVFKTTSSKLVELERQHHKLEQYTRRECLDFSGKEKKAEGLIFYFRVFNGTTQIRELQDPHVINIKHEYDI